jgi:hypothetical protein
MLMHFIHVTGPEEEIFRSCATCAAREVLTINGQVAGGQETNRARFDEG